MFVLNLKLNIWRIIGIIALILFAYLFFKIVIYLMISLVLFLVGYPLTYRIERLRFGKRKIPDGIAALITIVVILGVITALFFAIIPPLITEINFLSGLNFYDVLRNVLDQFPVIKANLLKLGDEEDLKQNITAEVNRFINPGNIESVLNNIFNYFGTIFGGTLCVLFITFFLLKDEQIVKQSLLTIAPAGHEGAMREIFKTSKRMLSKYFAGLFLDMFIVGTLVMISMTILGIKNALIISFAAAVLNVIPYIGSVIVMIIAIFLGVSGCISTGNYELIGPTINKIFFTLLSINLIDGFIIQPYIFSNSVKAHPLEIFIITLMAAILGGIFGMVIALPVYTLIRIIAKEFLTHLKFFKKISENLDG
ncbi:MAG: pheromone autoinducer 2 transporter [Bacteroidetes bacterium]|nr:pheromone autoinducer 2 transporter [Bacteroidota bacterium]